MDVYVNAFHDGTPVSDLVKNFLGLKVKYSNCSHPKRCGAAQRGLQGQLNKPRFNVINSGYDNFVSFRVRYRIYSFLLVKEQTLENWYTISAAHSKRPCRIHCARPGQFDRGAYGLHRRTCHADGHPLPHNGSIGKCT
jgi:hypothetical protein